MLVANTNILLGQQNSELKTLHATLKSKILETEQKNRIAVDSFRKLQKRKPNIANSKIELIRVDKTFGPIYYQTHNLTAAKSNRTNSIQPGGILGLNLEGENLKVGVWDAGLAFEGHQEFNENNETRILIGNENIDPDDHATHVSGTIIANGTNSEAKGMAPKATVVSYDWTNVRVEELNEVESGLLLSNHSYGAAGFEDNGDLAVPAEYFGTYESSSAYLDEMHFLYPNYLHVTSAGNDGLQSYPGGIATGYDKLLEEKNAKNNLVVANGKDINYITPTFYILDIDPSSSQGPTNDFRVKPDITGNGTGLISPIYTSPLSFNDYGNYSGTSMAAPSVTGSILLLQEYYYSLNQKYMRSATIKGLVCHTAYDIDDKGPDPESGWGYIDVKNAAEYITEQNKIYELTLTNNEVISFDITESNADIKVSICWTDPAGTAQSEPDYDQPVLVNDLDLKLVQNNTSYLPWKLSNAGVYTSNGWATKGDNSVDNIEIVDIEDANGSYTVEISHKGTLVNNEQKFSLILSKSTALTLGTSQIDDQNQQDIIAFHNSKTKRFVVKSNTKNPFTYFKVFDINGRIVKEMSVDYQYSFEASSQGIIKGVYFIVTGNAAKSFSSKTVIY